MSERPVYYRYEDVQYAAALNEWDEPVGRGDLRVHLREIPVIRLTPKGAWVGWGGATGAKKFILRSATKQHALQTKEEALTSFIARKRRQSSIYSARMRQADEAIVIAQKMEKTLCSAQSSLASLATASQLSSSCLDPRASGSLVNLTSL